MRRLVALGVVLLCAGTVAAQTEWVLDERSPVIPAVEPDEWPYIARRTEDVVAVDGTYHMFFTGTAVQFTYDHEIGHATSPDGITWTMDPQNPVMTPESEGDWGVTSYISLAVIHDGTEFRMWYGGVDSRGFSQVGMATSPDGSSWTPANASSRCSTTIRGIRRGTTSSASTVPFRAGGYPFDAGVLLEG